MTLETERSKYRSYPGVFSQIRGWAECDFCHERKDGSYQDNENHCVICRSCMDGSTHSTSMIRVKVEIRRHQFDDENPITWTTGTELDTSSYKTYQVPDDRHIQVWIENKYSKPLELKFVYGTISRLEWKKFDTILDFCVSSFLRNLSNLFCIVPI
jgi:hypothetical protein